MVLAFHYTHPRSGAEIAVCVPRDLAVDLRIGERVDLVCWGVMPSGMLRHPVLQAESSVVSTRGFSP